MVPHGRAACSCGRHYERPLVHEPLLTSTLTSTDSFSLSFPLFSERARSLLFIFHGVSLQEWFGGRRFMISYSSWCVGRCTTILSIFFSCALVSVSSCQKQWIGFNVFNQMYLTSPVSQMTSIMLEFFELWIRC